MVKQLLIIIDLQKDYYPGGAFELPSIIDVTQRAKRALQFFRETHQPVIHIRHIELDPEATFFLKGSEGSRIHPDVEPMGNELVIEKHFPNSFRETDLQQHIRRIQPEEVIFCGAMSNLCVDATVKGAFDFGYNCTVLHDACAASDLEFQGNKIKAQEVHRTFMSALASAYGRLATVEDFIEDRVK